MLILMIWIADLISDNVDIPAWLYDVLIVFYILTWGDE